LSGILSFLSGRTKIKTNILSQQFIGIAFPNY
jgi:hypothetical protein